MTMLATSLKRYGPRDGGRPRVAVLTGAPNLDLGDNLPPITPEPPSQVPPPVKQPVAAPPRPASTGERDNRKALGIAVDVAVVLVLLIVLRWAGRGQSDEPRTLVVAESGDAAPS